MLFIILKKIYGFKKVENMRKPKVGNDFDKIVDNYIKDMERYSLLKNGSLNDYPSRLT